VKRESLQKYTYVRKVHLEANVPHGITFAADGQTVKAVAKDSQAEMQSVIVGWKAFKLESDGVMYTGGFIAALKSATQECTVWFGVPANNCSSYSTAGTAVIKEDANCVHVHVRILVSRLYNCNIPTETFEGDVFAEFMWLAPWDFPAWKNYMDNLRKYEGYNDLLEALDVGDWQTPDTKPFVKPTTRKEEVYYSERVVQSFDRQLDLACVMGTHGFKPTWKPRIIFANLGYKSYDEMNFGKSSFSMVNIGNQWYTVWRRNISQAVFFETYELKNFPYDIQELTISVLCTHPKTRVKLVNHKCYRSSCVVLKENIMLPEWKYLGMRCSIGDDKSGRFSLFTFEAELRRDPSYFIKSGQFIFTIITLVSFLVYGMPSHHDFIGERLSYGSTMLLTTVAFKWLISEKIPNLPYDTYLDDYSQWGFYLQICIMLANGGMLFVRVRDEDGEIDTDVLCLYDWLCFGLIFTVWAIYQIYAYRIRVPRILRQESKRLTGMTNSAYERVGGNTLYNMTHGKTTPNLSITKNGGFLNRKIMPSLDEEVIVTSLFDKSYKNAECLIETKSSAGIRTTQL